MADKGYIKSLINGIADDTTRRALALAFDEVCDNFAVGPIENMKRAINGQSYFFQATTPASTNTEFVITHGQGQTPYWVRPVLPCDAVNATMPRLTISRAADDQQIYLTSDLASAAVFVEVGF